MEQCCVAQIRGGELTSLQETAPTRGLRLQKTQRVRHRVLYCSRVRHEDAPRMSFESATLSPPAQIDKFQGPRQGAWVGAGVGGSFLLQRKGATFCGRIYQAPLSLEARRLYCFRKIGCINSKPISFYAKTPLANGFGHSCTILPCGT